jgi:glycosyltransferase involved in cell wall biosynthesis
MKKKYLFLMKTSKMGGAERLQMDYFNFINYDKYSVTWAVNKDNFSSYLKKNNLPVTLIQLPELNKDGIFKKFLKFYNYLQEIKPDYIIFNQFWLISFSLPELLAGFVITKGKVFMLVHDCAPPCSTYKSRLHFGIIPGLGIGWRRERLFQKLLVYFTKKTLVVSKAAMEFLLRFHKFPQEKIKIAYHGVDIDKFTPSFENKVKLRRRLNISDSDKIIVSTSRFDGIKRVDRLIEAFRILAKERKNIQLMLVGTGPDYEKLMSIVSFLAKDIKNRIRFLGFREDIPAILQACDIFVLSSDTEGLSLAAMEAMSCGLVSVLSNTGGLPELIQDGFNGFLAEKSIEGLVTKINRALSLSEDEQRLLSANARKSILEKFNLEKNILNTLHILGLNDRNKLAEI